MKFPRPTAGSDHHRHFYPLVSFVMSYHLCAMLPKRGEQEKNETTEALGSFADPNTEVGANTPRGSTRSG